MRNVPTGQLRKVKETKELPEGHFEQPALRHPKRPAPTPLPKQPPRKRATPAPDHEPLSEYEKDRLCNIAYNNEFLWRLGLLY